MARRKRTGQCLDCGVDAALVGGLNHRGYCYACALEYWEYTARQLHAHAGPVYRRWQREMIRVYGSAPPAATERGRDTVDRP